MAWAPAYITTAELAAYMRIEDTDDDTDLALAVESASRAVDGHCNRQFGRVAVAEPRTYTAQWNPRRCRWVVDIDDVQDATGLTVAVPAGTVDVFTLTPANAVLKGLAWTQLVIGPTSAHQPTGAADEVTVAVRFGWLAFPNPVKQATKLQGSRFHTRRDSPYGVAGSPDAGSEVRLLARVDPDVAVSLRGLRRMRKLG